MEQDHQDVMTVRQSCCGLDGASKSWKRLEPAGAKTPSDPEAHRIASETAKPADHDDCA
jgi:hypothetical protein